MGLLYNFGIAIYGFVIGLAATFNPKAKLWVNGRKDLFTKLETADLKNENVVWVHCASLGEFEQGRPLIESIRREFPQKKILLTFFSPSGYEVRKNYDCADWVFYMPLDTRVNARKFIALVEPEMAVFVKYEFWANHFNELSNKNIPIIMISAIFRPNQRFFQSSGTWFRKTLRMVDHFFVQNEESVSLLQGIGITAVTKTGDTRFDRVKEIVSKSESIPLLDVFKGSGQLVILGSSWPQEEEMMAQCFENEEQDYKIIIAPHETEVQHCRQILELFKNGAVLYSELSAENVKEKEVLVIDNQGMLSSLYRYADIAIIGGGFGKGIHNILEAATFGMPILFGPNYKKFQEANDLIQLGGASTFSNSNDLGNSIHELSTNAHALEERARITKQYIADNTGATEIILEYLKKSL